MSCSSRIISEMTPQIIATVELQTGVLSALAECCLGDVT